MAHTTDIPVMVTTVQLLANVMSIPSPVRRKEGLVVNCISYLHHTSIWHVGWSGLSVHSIVITDVYFTEH